MYVKALKEERVMALDTDNLEKMILDNTGGNLVVIQILSGIDGMIQGLIQVHINFYLAFGAHLLISFTAHLRNMKRYS